MVLHVEAAIDGLFNGVAVLDRSGLPIERRSGHERLPKSSARNHGNRANDDELEILSVEIGSCLAAVLVGHWLRIVEAGQLEGRGQRG
jgi:hypothetical protein